jgi:RimJ/RimL family protein N-acetyltransferase
VIALAGTPVIRTARLVLRAPQAGDWEPWAAFATSSRARHIGGPLSRALAWRALGHLTGHWVHRGYGMFVFADQADWKPIGMAGPWFPEGWPEHEIGWSVWSAAAEGRGYAREAAAAARAWAFGTLGWDTAVSYVAPGNARSIALAERLGAVRDEAAAVPDAAAPTLVFRHPRPEAAS